MVGLRYVCYFLLITLSSCSRQLDGHNGNTDKEFEGVITYKISYESFNDSALYGDTLRLYFSKGNWIKKFNGTDPGCLRQEIFLNNGSMVYMNIGKSDTLYSYDISQNKNLTITSTKKNPSANKILNYTCESIEINQVFRSHITFFIDETYVFSKDALKVNPEHFKNWHFGDFNTYINHANALFLRYKTTIRSRDNGLVETKIYEAVDIKEEKLDPKLFEINLANVKLVTRL